jgi:hypothetical protein
MIIRSRQLRLLRVVKAPSLETPFPLSGVLLSPFCNLKDFSKRPYVDESGWVLAVPLAIDFAGEITDRRISNAAMAAAPAAVVARSLTWQLPTS